jgi:prepilin-type N-terminal cleavage/methylation domain-containing protein
MKKNTCGKTNTRKNSGFTMVELLVSMTLTALFATAIVALLPASTRIYMQLQSMSRAQVVADMVIDSLREECAEAYIDDFASVRIVNLGMDPYDPSTGDQLLLSTFEQPDPRTARFDSAGNVLIIRKNPGFCQAVYSCMPISYSNFMSVRNANILEGTSYIFPNPADGIGGISSRAVYRFYPTAADTSATPETRQGYVHFGYYQCGRENKSCTYNGESKTIGCIYPAVRYDYTAPFSSTAYNGYTVSLEFSDLQTSSDDIYVQRPLSVKVTVKVYACDYAHQASESPVYTRSSILVFAEDTTE